MVPTNVIINFVPHHTPEAILIKKTDKLSEPTNSNPKQRKTIKFRIDEKNRIFLPYDWISVWCILCIYVPFTVTLFSLCSVFNSYLYQTETQKRMRVFVQ